jgi:hypothetical protein
MGRYLGSDETASHDQLADIQMPRRVGQKHRQGPSASTHYRRAASVRLGQAEPNARRRLLAAPALGTPLTAMACAKHPEQRLAWLCASAVAL